MEAQLKQLHSAPLNGQNRWTEWERRIAKGAGSGGNHGLIRAIRKGQIRKRAPKKFRAKRLSWANFGPHLAHFGPMLVPGQCGPKLGQSWSTSADFKPHFDRTWPQPRSKTVHGRFCAKVRDSGRINLLEDEVCVWLMPGLSARGRRDQLRRLPPRSLPAPRAKKRKSVLLARSALRRLDEFGEAQDSFCPVFLQTNLVRMHKPFR